MRFTPDSRLAVLVLLALALPARAAEFEKYLPDETRMVMSFNLRQFLGAPAVREHAPTLMGHYGLELLVLAAEGNEATEKALRDNRQNLQKLLREKEDVLRFLDLVKDTLTHMIIAVDPLNPEEPLIFFQGEWSRDKVDALLTLAALFSPEDVKVSMQGKHKVFESTGGAGDTFVAAAPQDGMVVMTARPRMLVNVLDRVGRNGKPNLPREMQAALKDLDLTKTLSMVGLNPLNNLQIAMHAHLDKEFRAEVSAAAPDAATAKEMVDTFNQELENLRAEARNRKDLAALMPALKDAKVTARGTQVAGSITLTAAAIDDLVKKLIAWKLTN